MSPSGRYLSETRPIVAHVIDSLDGGGTERTLCSLLRSFDPDRQSHVVVTMREAGLAAAALPPSVACHPLAIRGRSRLAGLKLAAVVRGADASLIHARNTGCWADAILARLALPRVRLVLGFHGLEEAGPLPPRVRRLVRAGRALGATFVSVSNAGRDQLHDECGVLSQCATVIPNGVDRSRFRPAGEEDRRAVRESLELNESSVVIMTVGSLTTVKGHAILLEAFAGIVRSCPSACLLVVGDGPLRTALELQAQVLGIGNAVRWLGGREDVAQILSAADVYVCASQSEGLSNAVLEAMAVGCPIVSTRVGDHAAVIRDGREGLLVPANNVSLLADAMQRLADQPDTRQRLAWASSQRAADFDFFETIESYQRLYETMTERARRTSTGDAARVLEAQRSFVS